MMVHVLYISQIVTKTGHLVNVTSGEKTLPSMGWTAEVHSVETEPVARRGSHSVGTRS
jgi:hypothetical protein